MTSDDMTSTSANSTATPTADADHHQKEEEDENAYHQLIHDRLYGAQGIREDHVRAAQLLEEKMTSITGNDANNPVLHAMYADHQRLACQNDSALWDKAMQLGLLQQATAPHNNLHAMYYMGILYYTRSHEGCSSIEQDHFLAYEWFKRAAKEGHSSAMFSIGCLYHLQTRSAGLGKPSPQAIRKAKEWYEQAADAGHATAPNNLGLLYQHNASILIPPKGNPTDVETAALIMAKAWYEKAAEQGNHYGLYNLGVLYETKLKDKDMARAYYAQAAELGNPSAMRVLQRWHGGPSRKAWFPSIFSKSTATSREQHHEEESKLFLI